jgi:hypothetical protein
MLCCTRKRRRRVAAALTGALVLLAVPGPGAATPDAAAYLDRIADLPLMNGLRELPDAGVTFDKPSGRIVEAFAHGAVARAAVRSFYRETLPQLGWTRTAPGTFAREGERLTLDYLGGDGDLTVRFTLQPR